MARKTTPAGKTTTRKTPARMPATKKPAPVPTTKGPTDEEKAKALEEELAKELAQEEEEAAPTPRAKPKTYPLVCRDAAGEYTMTFPSVSARTKAAKTIQVALSRGPGARPRIVECIEGQFWFHVGGHFRIEND